ncbi:46315_t:CDS:2 [Gigaspora margarita]|uniref:46315_t:CDS:1 n=1 Tax=Gigaspora margarita TaxID=4874 RepID=A0ABM8W2Q7_GIGMA|nr:46315_t:CDS:2 [Gigaspora margarita]
MIIFLKGDGGHWEGHREGAILSSFLSVLLSSPALSPTLLSSLLRKRRKDVPLRENKTIDILKIHNCEITRQWHLEKVCEDGGHHHLYCDLEIIESDNPNPVAVIELLTTSSIPELNVLQERG